MPMPFFLHRLLDLAQTRSDAAARRLGELNSRQQEAEQKLRLLLGYRQNYQARFQEFAQSGIEQTEWQNFLAFMGKLDAAIAEQRQVAANSHTCTQAGRSEWHVQQRKLKSFDTLSQRHARAEFRRAAKQEQREQDEQTSKSFVHNKLALEHD